MSLILLSIGAGLASALLFAAAGAGSVLAGALAYVAPLPVLVVTLAWHQRAGLAAAVVAAAALAVSVRSSTALVFLLAFGLPGWWIGFLALMGRRSADGTDWYPVGRLLAWIAGLATLATVIGALAIGRLDYDSYRGVLSNLIGAFLRYEAGVGHDAPIPSIGGISAERLTGLVAGAVPLIAAASFALLLTVNAWLAGRIASVSGRLPRPWPFLPATRMPSATAGLALIALAAVNLPGYAGVAGAALLGSLGMVFALQGLAFCHAATWSRPGRGVMLGLLYVLTMLFGGTMLPLLSVVGLLDSATPVRRRLSLPLNRPE